MLERGKSGSEKDREQIRLAAKKIDKYMRWTGSKKGFDYWEAVYNELLRISKTGEP